jgi:hypothetical protein
MKKTVWFIMCIFTCHTMVAQNDTIFSEGQKFGCIIKEITLNDVIFIYPGETVKNLIEKNKIQKIIYKSGQVESSIDSIVYKKVNGPGDFNNVTLTHNENQTKRLFKLGDISSKASGTTLSASDKLKTRAYMKLSIEAAMLGANVVYLTRQESEDMEPGHHYFTGTGSFYSGGKSASTHLAGIAYTNLLPEFVDFQNLIGDSANFIVFEVISLSKDGMDMIKKIISKNITINKVWNENGLIMLDAKITGVKNNIFRVISFDSNAFTLMNKSQYTIYNYKVKI